MADKKYKVAEGQILTSRADGKNYPGGKLIDLSHCTPEEIQNLIQLGLIVENNYTVKATKYEVKDV